MAAVGECDFELSQLPYFADLAPLDFKLSRYLKELLHGHALGNDEAVIVDINEWTDKQDQKFLLRMCKNIAGKMGK